MNKISIGAVINKDCIMHFKSLAAFILALPVLSQAHELYPELTPGTAYEQVKSTLIQNGWQPINNANIKNSSLYAQELYQLGNQEVADCISMELDGCWFKYKKGKQILQVKTITRKLTLEKIDLLSR
jgi:hypothetical protein